MSVDTSKIQKLNDALDRERARRGLRNDVALADALGLSPKTVSFWRNGRLTRTDNILLDILIQATEPAELVNA